jgi:hypothetical protein
MSHPFGRGTDNGGRPVEPVWLLLSTIASRQVHPVCRAMRHSHNDPQALAEVTNADHSPRSLHAVRSNFIPPEQPTNLAPTHPADPASVVPPPRVAPAASANASRYGSKSVQLDRACSTFPPPIGAAKESLPPPDGSGLAA